MFSSISLAACANGPSLRPSAGAPSGPPAGRCGGSEEARPAQADCGARGASARPRPPPGDAMLRGVVGNLTTCRFHAFPGYSKD